MSGSGARPSIIAALCNRNHPSKLTLSKTANDRVPIRRVPLFSDLGRKAGEKARQYELKLVNQTDEILPGSCQQTRLFTAPHFCRSLGSVIGLCCPSFNY